MIALLALSCHGAKETADDLVPDTAAAEPTGPTGTIVATETAATGGTGDATGSSHTGTSTATNECDTSPSVPFSHCGCLVTALQLGSIYGDSGHALSPTADGGVVLGGDFAGTVTFGAGEPTEITFVGSGGGPYTDGFVAKYRSDGALDWARRHLDAGASFVETVAVEPVSGRVVAGGRNFSELTVDGGGVQFVLPYLWDDAYVVSYDGTGTLQWGAVAGSADGREEIEQVAFGPAGEVYLVGWTEDDTLDFTSTNGSTVQLEGLGPTGAGETTGFLARIDPDGTLAWVEAFAGAGTQKAEHVAVQASGQVVVEGTYSPEIVLDPGGPAEVSLPAGLSQFLAGFTSSGDLSWSQRLDSDTSNDMAGVVGTNGFLVAGYLGGNAVWAEGTPEETVIVPTAGTVAHFTPDHVLDRTHVFYTWDPTISGRIDPADLDVNGDGASFAVAGLQIDQATFGAGELHEVTVNADPADTNAWDPLLLVFEEDGSLDCFWHLDGSETFDQAYGVAFDTEGGVWVTGKFSGTLTLAEGRPDAQTLTSSYVGSPDLFLARFLLRPAGGETADTGP